MAVIIKWNGDTTGRPTASAYGSRGCQVSNRVFKKEELLGGIITVVKKNRNGDEVVHQTTITESSFHSRGGDTSYRAVNGIANQEGYSTSVFTGYEGKYSWTMTYSIDLYATGTFFAKFESYVYDEYTYTAALYLPNASGDPKLYNPTGGSGATNGYAYGWTDGGADDIPSGLNVSLVKGWTVSGCWRCIADGAGGATFQWYKDGKLVSTESGVTASDCKPSATEAGTSVYHCVVTFADGGTLTTENMTVTVIEDDPGGGEDPDNPGGGGGGGDDPDPDPDPDTPGDVTNATRLASFQLGIAVGLALKGGRHG